MRLCLFIFLFCLIATASAADKPQVVVQLSPTQLDVVRQKSPGPVFPKSDVPPQPSPPPQPSFTENISYLKGEKCFTFVPKPALLAVGNASMVEVLPDHASLQGLGTYVPAQEFIVRFKTQFVVLQGKSLGVGKVAIPSHYSTPADKIVIAVDPSNVPAFTVTPQ